MTYEIIKNIPRSRDDLKKAKLLASYGTATTSDAHKDIHVMEPSIRPITPGSATSGKAITVECNGADNLMVRAALEQCTIGDILVVSTPKGAFHGFFGELMGKSAMTKGVAGLIIDGGVRDSKQLSEMGFYISSRYVAPLKTTKKTPGNVNKPIVCGGIQVNPGDFIVADDDGVVVVPWQIVDEVIEQSEKIIEQEKIKRARISKGNLSFDVDTLRDTLYDLGISYSEGGSK